MSKTLSHIMLIFKIARIIAKIVFVFLIIGAVGCVIGLSVFPLLEGFLSNQEISEVLVEEGIADIRMIYPVCIAGLIACVGELIFTFFSIRYFEKTLNDGTPFTLDGSKQCFRLGISAIIVSLSITVAISITFSIYAMLTSTIPEADTASGISLSTGLFFMFLSLIFKHGAELRIAHDESEKIGNEPNSVENQSDNTYAEN